MFNVISYMVNVMFDTHAHLNFKSFKKNLEQVIAEAKSVGINQIVVPGTDIESSKRAVEIAKQYEGIYAAVGIHPHHVFDVEFKIQSPLSNPDKIKIIISHSPALFPLSSRLRCGSRKS